MLIIDGKESQKKHRDSVSIVKSQIRIVMYSENQIVTKKDIYFCLYTEIFPFLCFLLLPKEAIAKYILLSFGHFSTLQILRSSYSKIKHVPILSLGKARLLHMKIQCFTLHMSNQPFTKTPHRNHNVPRIYVSSPRHFIKHFPGFTKLSTVAIKCPKQSQNSNTFLPRINISASMSPYNETEQMHYAIPGLIRD